MTSIIDNTGKKYGRLTVVSRNHKKPHVTHWDCLCSCGNYIVAFGGNLKNGHTESCGCLQKEAASKAKKTHGKTCSLEYHSWSGLKGRCLNPKNHKYPNYGGRGIKVCDRWENSFENFLADMGEKPSASHSIERVDNNGDYTPENCIWGTASQQANNKTSSVFMEHNGVTLTQSQWSIKLGGSDKLVLKRLKRGWSKEKALSTPCDKTRHKIFT